MHNSKTPRKSVIARRHDEAICYLTPIPFSKLIGIVYELSHAESFDEKNLAKTNRLLRRASSQ